MLADTPLMQQFVEFKGQCPDALLFIRCGDFYELFHDDARVAAKELQIVLTSRNKTSDQPVPMAGVPYHAYEEYAARLIEKGYKIAICEQIEDPKLAKGIVKRAITQILSPGTVNLQSALKPGQNNFLAVLKRIRKHLVLLLADVTTSEISVFESLWTPDVLQKARELLEIYRPSECLLSPDLCSEEWLYTLGMRIQPQDIKVPSDYPLLTSWNYISQPVLIASGLDQNKAVRDSLECLFSYLQDIGVKTRVQSLKPLLPEEFLILDANSIRSLELVTGHHQGGPSLYSTLDFTRTAAGSRMLRQTLLQPLRQEQAIALRHTIVASLKENGEVRQELRRYLSEVYDLSRLAHRVHNGSISAAIFNQIAATLNQVPRLNNLLQSIGGQSWLTEQPDVIQVSNMISQVIASDPPLKLGDGDTIRDGVSPDLDRWRKLRNEADLILRNLEENERKQSGLKSLKLKFNRVFGYYLELPSSQSKDVPEHFVRKQTLVNAERFTTSELKTIEKDILEADHRCHTLEQELLNELRGQILDMLDILLVWSQNLAFIDVMQSFAEAAATYDYTRPEFSSESLFTALAARHPVVERTQSQFVANDILLQREQDQILLITGPNMGGKSTYLRQCALIAIMAQAGCFVPARRCQFKPFDKIFTRIGASDHLSSGKSTFMVEMSEAATLLGQATPDSLILLDEIGRGTATFDGLALAWAILAHIATTTKSLCLFATHYHELTQISQIHPGVRNCCVSVIESNGSIQFQHLVKKGAADKSWGIHVAQLAGLPKEVVQEAKAILHELEQSRNTIIGLDSEQKRLMVKGRQPLLIPRKPKEVPAIVQRILQMDPDKMTPVEALHAIYALKDFASAEVRLLESEPKDR